MKTLKEYRLEIKEQQEALYDDLAVVIRKFLVRSIRAKTPVVVFISALVYAVGKVSGAVASLTEDAHMPEPAFAAVVHAGVSAAGTWGDPILEAVMEKALKDNYPRMEVTEYTKAGGVAIDVEEGCGDPRCTIHGTHRRAAHKRGSDGTWS